MIWILLHVSLLVPAVQMSVLNGSTVDWTRSNLSLPIANTTRGEELTEPFPLNRTTTAAPQTGNLTLNVTSDPRTSTRQTSTRQTSTRQTSTRQTPQVKGPFPEWAKVLLGSLVVLVLIASGGVFCHFRHNFRRGYIKSIEVDSGQPFVLLPCRTNDRLPSNASVEWTDRHGNKVHVFQNHCTIPEKQIQFYRTRTMMSLDPLQTGDLSLNLRLPTGADTDIFTCCVYSRRKRILMKKQVQLQVKGQLTGWGQSFTSTMLSAINAAQPSWPPLFLSACHLLLPWYYATAVTIAIRLCPESQSVLRSNLWVFQPIFLP